MKCKKVVVVNEEKRSSNFFARKSLQTDQQVGDVNEMEKKVQKILPSIRSTFDGDAHSSVM